MSDFFVRKHREAGRIPAWESTRKRVGEGLGFMAAPTIASVATHAVYPGTISEAIAAASGVAISIGGIALHENHTKFEEGDET